MLHTVHCVRIVKSPANRHLVGVQMFGEPNNIDWRTCFELKGKLMELWILFMMFIILLKFYRRVAISLARSHKLN